MTAEEAIARINLATRPSEVERAWLAFFKATAFPPATRRARAENKIVRAAVEAAGWRLVKESPWADQIPRIIQKGRSLSVEIGGRVFPAGRWGNGPGMRWVYGTGRTIAFTEGRHRSRRLSDDIWDWVAFGMPHRALLRLRRR